MLGWCLDDVLVVSWSCLGGGVAVLFWRCLGHVSVVSLSCFGGVRLMFGSCAGMFWRSRQAVPRKTYGLEGPRPPCEGPAPIFLYWEGLMSVGVCGFGGATGLFRRWLAAVVSRSQSMCVYELCFCVSIHLLRIAPWCLNVKFARECVNHVWT